MYSNYKNYSNENHIAHLEMSASAASWCTAITTAPYKLRISFIQDFACLELMPLYKNFENMLKILSSKNCNLVEPFSLVSFQIVELPCSPAHAPFRDILFQPA